MFFRKDYAAPGPGVDPDEPEKTGVARLAEILSLECVTLVKLNLLFLLSCLPVLFLPFMLCSTVFLLTLLASTYFYGLLTTERSVRECLRLSLILGAGRPLRAVLAALAVYGMLLFSVLEFPLSGIYLLLIGFSGPCLLGGFFIRTVLKRLEERSGT